MSNTLAQSIEEQAMERIQNIMRAYASKKISEGGAWGKITRAVNKANALIESRQVVTDGRSAVKELRDALEAEEKDLKERIAKLERAQSDFEKAMNY